MSKKISKLGATEVTQTMDRLASLIETKSAELYIPERVAKDLTMRLDRVADHVEKVFGLQNAAREASASNGGFDSGEIANQEAGPLQSESDEAGYMSPNFTEQEHSELSKVQQNGEQGFATSKAAGCENLPEGGMRDNCEKKVEEGKKNKGKDDEEEKGGKNAAVANLLRAAAAVLAEDDDEEEDSEESSDDDSDEEEDSEESSDDSDDEDDEDGKKASFGFNLYA